MRTFQFDVSGHQEEGNKLLGKPETCSLEHLRQRKRKKTFGLFTVSFERIEFLKVKVGPNFCPVRYFYLVSHYFFLQRLHLINFQLLSVSGSWCDSLSCPT